MSVDNAREVYFEQHPDPMGVFDPVTLRFLDVNRAALEHYGYTREEFLQLRVDDVVMPDELPALRKLIASRSARPGKPFQARYRVKSGDVIHVEINDTGILWEGRPARLFSLREITRLVELERDRFMMQAREDAARRTTERLAQRFESLFAAVPGKFMVLSPTGFEILAASDAYLQAIHIPREKLIGKPLFSTFSEEQVRSAPEGERSLRESLERVIATRRPDAMDVQGFPLHGPDGTLRLHYWCAVNSPVLDAQGDIAYIFHRVEDVTDLLGQGDIKKEEVPVLLSAPAAFELVLRTRELEGRAQQLEAQVAEMRHAQQLLALATWTLQLNTGELVVSANFHALLGTDATTFTPTLEGYLALVHPDDRDTMRRSLDTFLADGARHYQVRQRIIRPDDGRTLHVMVVGERQPGSGAAAIAFITQDVTAQFEAAQELGKMAMLTRMAGRVARLGGWQYEVQTRRLVWDPATFAIFGLPPDSEPLGVDKVMVHYAPEYRDRVLNAFLTCIETGEPFDQLVEFIDAHDRRFWVRAMGEATLDADGNVLTVQGAVQDVDELVRSRLEAESLSVRLAETLESISDAFFMLDRDWRFTFMNSQAGKLLDRRPEDLLGKVVWDEFPAAVGSRFHTEYERVFHSGETARFDAFYGPLGKRFNVNAYPVPEGLAVYFTDITEQHRRDELARVNDERFQLIAKATNDVVWDWDIPNGTLWWNDGIRTLFGYEPESIEPRINFWTDHIHPDDLARITSSVHAALAGTASTWTGEYRFMHADGRALTVIDRGFLIRDGNGRTVRMIGSMLDISERLLLDAQLRQSQKLEAVGYLTGGVAHDFNNLLTVILGNAMLLQEQLAGNERLQSLATMIESAAQRGAELTQRMLAFSRRQALDPQVIDVNALVGGMEAMFRRTLPEDIELQLRCDPDTWATEVDPGQLEVALLNLVVNARDAMPGGGHLVISIGNAHLDADATRGLAGVAPGDYVRLTVTDTGSGIAPELLHRVFDPFFTTKEVGKGSGLGLSMVYGFVKQSNGHIHLGSEPGRGTTVTLYLPRSAATPAALESPRSGDWPGMPRGTEHLLVVEDNELVRLHVVEQLRGLGYRVTHANCGEQALEKLQEIGEVALLFTDVVMPGMSGRELAEQVAKLRPGVKIIFTSGYTQDTMVHNGRLEAGVHLLSKPYRPQQLARRIREVLDED